MNHVEKTVEYKVWYKLNPEYKGTFQVDKIGPKTGLHGTFGASAGGFDRAQQEIQKCKAWFNEEKKAIEREGPGGKAVVEVRTTIHDNVIVWMETYIDGFPTNEVGKQWEEPKQKPEQDQDELAKLRAEMEELRELLAAKETPKKGRKKDKEEEEQLEEAMA